MICSIDVGLLGVMGLWGISLNFFTMLILMLAMGLAVDCNCHIAHAFANGQGTPNERATAALASVGPAVCGVSTFVGFVFAAFSPSHFGIVLCKLFTSIAVLA
eukprot:gene17546-23941_t